MLKIEELKEIIQIIDESSVSEFTYEHEGSQVTIKKPTTSVAAPVTYANVDTTSAVTAPKQPENIPAAPISDASMEANTMVGQAEQDDNLTEIISPMVGTFYRKPSPDSETYVELGDTVSSASIVCTIEAMKLFNEIESETNGEIVDILVNDGELVEYGQALFKVKTKEA